MSQNSARRDPQAKSEDVDPAEAARQAEHKQGVRPRRPIAQPADDGVSPDGRVSPDEPGEDEIELIGGIDDLSAVDLGPAAPNAHDPDADSGRPRKITRERGRDTGRGAQIARPDGQRM
jgi:hypothetical protein